MKIWYSHDVYDNISSSFKEQNLKLWTQNYYLQKKKPKILSVFKTLFLLLQTDAHNYKIIGILKQLKFRLSLRHVSFHAGTSSIVYSTLAQQAGMPPWHWSRQ